MINKSLLQDNTLIICPNNQKEYILNYLSETKQIINIKFMTIDEYKKNYLFDYDVKTIEYLHTSKNLLPANAKEILENLYYIDENKNYNNAKLNNLKQIKQELINNDLLIFNPLFPNFLSKYNIIVYGYGNLNKFYNSIINGKIIPFEKKSTNKILYEFNDIEEETEYLFTEIINLLKNGTDINDIVVTNISNDYIPYIKRYEKYYDIKIQFQENNSIIGTSLVKEFIKKLDNQNANEIYQWLIDKNSTLSSTLISILNKYADFNNLNGVIELIKDDLSHINIKQNKLKNSIKTINIFDGVQDNQHLFFLGFNDKIPAIYRDNEYITDNIRNEVNMSTTHQLNKLSKENTIAWLSQISNLHLSYSKRSPFNTFNCSFIADECGWNTKNYQFNKNYSKELLLKKYSSLLDNYRKYNDSNNKEEIEKYYNLFQKADYLSYDNAFKEFHFTLNNLQLSYTSLSTFYQCPFRYYLSNILKLNDNQKSFYSELGTAIHSVLEKISTNNSNNIKTLFRQEINNLDQDIISDGRNAMFIDIIEDKLKDVVTFIQSHQKECFSDTGLKELHEKNIEIVLDKNTKFKGIIDKIMYTESNGKIYLAVIDYKTGSVDSNITKLDEVNYGFSLQLPIYMYLIKKAKENNLIKEFKDKEITFCGFYLQFVLNKMPKADHKKDLKTLCENDLKLNGYSSNSTDNMSMFDPNIDRNNESKYIKSLSLTKNNTPKANSKTFNEDKLKELIVTVDNKIKEASKEIYDGKFLIQPKIINNVNRSCQYCPFGSICYKRNENYSYISTQSDKQEDTDNEMDN